MNFDRIDHLVVFGDTAEYFYGRFVPFLWQKERILPFLSICHSIVDTGRVMDSHNIHSGYFSNKENDRFRNDTTDLLPCRSSRKLLGKDFRSTEKYRPNRGKTRHGLSLTTVNRDNLKELATRSGLHTPILVSSDCNGQVSECIRKKKHSEWNRTIIHDWSAPLSNRERIDFLETKKAFDLRTETRTACQWMTIGNNRIHYHCSKYVRPRLSHASFLGKLRDEKTRARVLNHRHGAFPNL